MRRQRPVPARTAGAVAVLALVAGCGSGTVEVPAPAVSGAAAQRCAALVKALPRSVDDQARRAVSTGAREYGAAWGNPPVVLSCGVARPQGLNRFATCQQVNGVGWFVPPAQIDRGPGPITMTTIGFHPRVQVQLPGDYWPPAAAMADLAKPVKGSLQHTHSCV